MKKIKGLELHNEVQCNDGKKRTILIYGELSEDNILTGYAPVAFTRKGRIVVSAGEPIITDHEFRAPLKTFNMGWALCDERDEFDREKGIRIAKKRFAKSPITTQNGNFLTKDMINAIMMNELHYIANNVERFTNKFKKKM